MFLRCYITDAAGIRSETVVECDGPTHADEVFTALCGELDDDPETAVVLESFGATVRLATLSPRALPCAPRAPVALGHVDKVEGEL